MSHETIVTMFSTVAQAEGAKRNLQKAGFHENDIDIISGERLRKEGHEVRHPGLWQRLFGDKVDDEQAGTYEEALATGGVVLTLRADEEQLPRAMGILDAHDDSPQPGAADVAAPETLPSADEQKLNRTDAVRTALTGDESEEDILRLAEERLEVGKRLVSEGSTRVRRYTVTDRVSENISLQEQHADIFRRPLDNTVTPEGVDWSEKTVKIEESHEQPVINKTAHVKEEVVVRKDVNERTETVNDSVRRQEVDIEHAAPETAVSKPSDSVAAVPADVPGTQPDGKNLSGKIAAAKDYAEGKPGSR